MAEPVPGMEPVEEVQEDTKHPSDILRVINAFNKAPLDPQVWGDWSIERRATLLFTCDDLSREAVGEFLAASHNHEEAAKCLRWYCSFFDMKGKRLDVAFGEFSNKFRLPLDSSKVEILIRAFAEEYIRQYPDAFAEFDDPEEKTNRAAMGDVEVATSMCFCLIMLNTDHFNPYLPPSSKMTLPQFLRASKGLGYDQWYLMQLYHGVVDDYLLFSKEDRERLKLAHPDGFTEDEGCTVM